MVYIYESKFIYSKIKFRYRNLGKKIIKYLDLVVLD